MITSASSRSEEHTSELQSLAVISYAVFCLKKKKKTTDIWYRFFYSLIKANSNISSYRLGGAGVVDVRQQHCQYFIFFFNDAATTEIYTTANTLSLHDALPI